MSSSHSSLFSQEPINWRAHCALSVNQPRPTTDYFWQDVVGSTLHSEESVHQLGYHNTVMTLLLSFNSTLEGFGESREHGRVGVSVAGVPVPMLPLSG